MDGWGVSRGRDRQRAVKKIERVARGGWWWGDGDRSKLKANTEQKQQQKYNVPEKATEPTARMEEGGDDGKSKTLARGWKRV